MADSNPTGLCQCGCGQPTKPAHQTDSKRGYVKGRPHKFAHGHNYKKHGHTWTGGHSPTYTSWAAMMTRCLNPNVPGFEAYGGAGITVCDRWRSFENFLADMGERPPRTSLDRFPDNQGNYEPGNCRWATTKQQRLNQSEPRLVLIEHNGESRYATAWAEIFGMSPYVVLRRYREGERPPQLFRPAGNYADEPIEYMGQSRTLAEWTRVLGFKGAALYNRRRNGERPPELFRPAGVRIYKRPPRTDKTAS